MAFFDTNSLPMWQDGEADSFRAELRRIHTIEGHLKERIIEMTSNVASLEYLIHMICNLDEQKGPYRQRRNISGRNYRA